MPKPLTPSRGSPGRSCRAGGPSACVADESWRKRHPVPERSAASIPMNRRPHPECDARREPQALPHPATRLHESKHQTPELAAHPQPRVSDGETLAEDGGFGKSGGSGGIKKIRRRSVLNVERRQVTAALPHRLLCEQTRQDPRKSSTIRLNSSGFSIMAKCPVSGMITSSAPGISSAINFV